MERNEEYFQQNRDLGAARCGILQSSSVENLMSQRGCFELEEDTGGGFAEDAEVVAEDAGKYVEFL